MNGKVPDQQLWHLLQTAGSFYKYTVFNPLFSKFGSFYFVCRRQLHFKSIRTKKKYLVEDEWALQATFAGSICQQVGLHLLQAGQQRATGTTWGETTTLERWHFSWYFMLQLASAHHSIFLDWGSWKPVIFCMWPNMYKQKYYLFLPHYLQVCNHEIKQWNPK